MKKFNENFTKADAEAMGLMVGSKIQYIKPMENNQNRKIIKNGTVYQLWKSHFHRHLGQGRMERNFSL